jgi:ATP/maltotriose-dependent transcriptional regulator MalT
MTKTNAELFSRPIFRDLPQKWEAYMNVDSEIEEMISFTVFIEPLTKRELEILQLIARGLSDREIAETLSIALNTAKKHASTIYGKWGVKRRTQAVALARDLGIL